MVLLNISDIEERFKRFDRWLDDMLNEIGEAKDAGLTFDEVVAIGLKNYLIEAISIIGFDDKLNTD